MLTENQSKRLRELRDYVRVLKAAGNIDREQAINIGAWILLIEKDQ